MQANPLRALLRHKRGAVAFVLAALAALLVVAISEAAYWESTRAMERLATMTTARNHLLKLSQRVVDAESGERGYLLTGRREYLDPYRSAFDDITRALTWLKGYYAAEPEQAGAMQKLDTLVQRKMSELDATLRLFDEGKTEAWRSVLLTDIGKEQMEEIRSASEHLLAVEGRRFTAGRQSVFSTLLLTRVGVAAMSVISLLALALYLRQTAALVAHRQAQQQATEAERDRLEVEVARRTALLIELAQHLQTAREDERSRLARELHDELGALLTAAKLDAARIRTRLGNSSPEAAERLAHLNETLNNGIALKRRIIEDLRPSSLANLGLLASLEIQAREFGERSGVKVDCRLDPVDLPPASELTVYRLVQEAFTNIAKYAQAKHVELTLAEHSGAAEVSVRDDGVGFDTRVRRPSTHGLL
ncbi:MAG TPA: CHASE3 domain-containing protein, partial [Albitalea sp.]|nr:CHASE3 domain-containing protein [Albitalea sp.]